ncbi:hypothetical protein D3C71_2195100 [compost metagenome]
MPPMPSTPAVMPTARKITSTGMPMRAENELTRMLTPTSNAPTKNRLLTAAVSTAGSGGGLTGG